MKYFKRHPGPKEPRPRALPWELLRLLVDVDIKFVCSRIKSFFKLDPSLCPWLKICHFVNRRNANIIMQLSLRLGSQLRKLGERAGATTARSQGNGSHCL